jgi:hypothetical protein
MLNPDIDAILIITGSVHAISTNSKPTFTPFDRPSTRYDAERIGGPCLGTRVACHSRPWCRCSVSEVFQCFRWRVVSLVCSSELTREIREEKKRHQRNGTQRRSSRNSCQEQRDSTQWNPPKECLPTVPILTDCTSINLLVSFFLDNRMV